MNSFNLHRHRTFDHLPCGADGEDLTGALRLATHQDMHWGREWIILVR